MVEKKIINQWTVGEQIKYSMKNWHPDNDYAPDIKKYDIQFLGFSTVINGVIRINIRLEKTLYQFDIPSLNFEVLLFKKFNFIPSANSKAHIDGVYRVVSPQKRIEILDRQQWQCNNCGCRLKASRKDPTAGELAHIDHIHPYALRASYPKGPEQINEDENLQALCYKCNISKNTNLN